ncbi:hypothetical protein [Marinobacter sp. SS13-12]|nr:hypothetical protein [Marinobacter sp. SS13-12]MDK8465381.1 hypothetical protein [Marinobacter sp. SS13-12]
MMELSISVRFDLAALLLVGGWYRLRELQQERDFGRQLPYWSG